MSNHPWGDSSFFWYLLSINDVLQDKSTDAVMKADSVKRVLFVR